MTKKLSIIDSAADFYFAPITNHNRIRKKVDELYNIYNNGICLICYDGTFFPKSFHRLANSTSVIWENLESGARIFFFFKPSEEFFLDLQAFYLLNLPKIEEMNTIYENNYRNKTWRSISLNELKELCGQS